MLPLVPGHEIVGTWSPRGRGRDRASSSASASACPGSGCTCGACRYCREGRENLCADARFTGYQLDGGFAEYTVADARYCFPLPEGYAGLQAAPLLCAGLIGYRAYRMALEGPARSSGSGLYGFGAAAHIICQVALHEGARSTPSPGPGTTRRRRSPASWGRSGPAPPTSAPPVELDAAILFAPVGELVPAALRAVAPGRRGGLRRDPHERHPALSLRDPLGGARSCARWPT